MQRITNRVIPMFEGYCRKNEIDGKEIVATISGNKVTLKVAANDDTKAKGLMGSDEPGDDNGMIFVYEAPAILDFWMKNVEYDLDILFFEGLPTRDIDAKSNCFMFQPTVCPVKLN